MFSFKYLPGIDADLFEHLARKFGPKYFKLAVSWVQKFCQFVEVRVLRGIFVWAQRWLGGGQKQLIDLHKDYPDGHRTPVVSVLVIVFYVSHTFFAYLLDGIVVDIEQQDQDGDT
jgi:hypothetical protein